MTTPDQLAELANPQLRGLWEPAELVRAERRLWCAVLQAQVDLGVPTPAGALPAYRSVIDLVDLESIRQRELVTHHDLKARLDEFCHLAGYQVVHRGMTSADVVENMAQYRLRQSMLWLVEHHPQSAGALAGVLERYPLRGIKGPMGTQQDQLDLLGSHEACATLDRVVADALGFPRVLVAVPQVLPRSLDLDVGTSLVQCCRGPWAILANGYLTMLASNAGDTWGEGDVSTSVVRRVALPALVFLADISLSLTNT